MEAWREELYHHGIKGQKWGVRRYQNADGTLTEAGKKRQRYTHGKDDLYNEDTKKLVSLARGATQMIGSGGIMGVNAGAGIGRTYITKGGKGREKRLENALGESKRRLDSGELNEKEIQKETKRSEKLNRKLQAQRKANDARDLYDSYTSNGKMLAQDLLLGSFGAEMYRNARARGASRVRSWFETGLGPVAAVLRGTANKKRYGDWFVASDGSSDELYAKERLHSSNDIG